MPGPESKCEASACIEQGEVFAKFLVREALEEVNTARELAVIENWISATGRMLQEIGRGDDAGRVLGEVNQAVQAKRRELFKAEVRRLGGEIKGLTVDTSSMVHQAIGDLAGLRGGLPPGKEEQLLGILKDGFDRRMEQLLTLEQRGALAGYEAQYELLGGRNWQLVQERLLTNNCAKLKMAMAFEETVIFRVTETGGVLFADGVNNRGVEGGDYFEVRKEIYGSGHKMFDERLKGAWCRATGEPFCAKMSFILTPRHYLSDDQVLAAYCAHSDGRITVNPIPNRRLHGDALTRYYLWV